jgi:hypothetical protein
MLPQQQQRLLEQLMMHLACLVMLLLMMPRDSSVAPPLRLVEQVTHRIFSGVDPKTHQVFSEGHSNNLAKLRLMHQASSVRRQLQLRCRPHMAHHRQLL